MFIFTPIDWLAIVVSCNQKLKYSNTLRTLLQKVKNNYIFYKFTVLVTYDFYSM